MNHKIGYNKLNRTAAHRKALVRSLVTALLKQEKIVTTKQRLLKRGERLKSSLPEQKSILCIIEGLLRHAYMATMLLRSFLLILVLDSKSAMAAILGF